uniref:Uncharacterized protein n=1 Tax=Clostridium scatologenes TaxID=1548 RepID=A0A0E3M7R7_CLOSL|nr:hypothetical protein [Clostridium scatologenes]AKA70665.1 hypothetical protein CSCA_3540 [Clostridium scatologenes]
MKKSSKHITVMITICFLISLYGIVVISSNLPKFIKDKTDFRIDYSKKPFDFRFEVGEYSLYINSKAVTNIKNSSGKIINNIGRKVHDNTSYMLNKTSDVFKYVEEKVSNTVQHKVK